MTPQDVELTTSQLGNHFVTAADAETVQDTGKTMSKTNKMIDRLNMTKLSFYSIKDPERSRLLTLSLRYIIELAHKQKGQPFGGEKLFKGKPYIPKRICYL